MFGRPRVADGERDAKMDAMANTASRPESLNEHLLGQWALLDIDNPRISSAGELIINYIDEDGYLRTDLNEIAEQQVPPFTPEEMEEALGWVQTLEPAGIGARDLKECFLIQLDLLAEEEDVELERLLVENHLPDIEKTVPRDLQGDGPQHRPDQGGRAEPGPAQPPPRAAGG